MLPYIVAITGASGVIYGKRFVECLVDCKIPVYLILSDPAKQIIQDELKIKVKPEIVTSLLGKTAKKYITVFKNNDLTAPIASGSCKTAGMLVIPCSMATLSAIATGNSRSLIERAADVTLKEHRRLILVPREMPLNAIHLKNMLELSQIGVDIVPPMPGFYHHPKAIEDMVDFVVGKVLDLLQIDHNLYRRWNPKN
ncbi:MAG: flavin prenyltransferase UbiX [bacterium]|nr:flavin prenyltransferase UbiX [bacterium]